MAKCCQVAFFVVFTSTKAPRIVEIQNKIATFVLHLCHIVVKQTSFSFAVSGKRVVQRACARSLSQQFAIYNLQSIALTFIPLSTKLNNNTKIQITKLPLFDLPRNGNENAMMQATEMNKHFSRCISLISFTLYAMKIRKFPFDWLKSLLFSFCFRFLLILFIVYVAFAHKLFHSHCFFLHINFKTLRKCQSFRLV